MIQPLTDTPSREQFGEGYIIEKDDLNWFSEQYFTLEDDLSDPRVALHSAKLSDLPDTLVLTNECDPLRDEAELLVAKMTAAGVDARARRFNGLAHGTFWMSKAVPRCEEMRVAAAEFVRKRGATKSTLADSA